MINLVRELAVKHDIFVSVLPVCVGWELRYEYRIQEPMYDKYLYQGYGIEIDIQSEKKFETYDEAMLEGLKYVKEHSRLVPHNGMLTLYYNENDEH